MRCSPSKVIWEYSCSPGKLAALVFNDIIIKLRVGGGKNKTLPSMMLLCMMDIKSFCINIH